MPHFTSHLYTTLHFLQFLNRQLPCRLLQSVCNLSKFSMFSLLLPVSFIFDGDQCCCILTLTQFSMRNKQTLVTNALELGVICKLHFKLFCYIFVSNEHQHWNRLPVIVDMALNKERQNSAITDKTLFQSIPFPLCYLKKK